MRINKEYIRTIVTNRLSEGVGSSELEVHFDTKKVLDVIRGLETINPKEQVSIIIGDLPKVNWNMEGFQDLHDSFNKQFRKWIKTDLKPSLGDSADIRYLKSRTTPGGVYQIRTKDSGVYMIAAYRNVLGAYISEFL